MANEKRARGMWRRSGGSVPRPAIVPQFVEPRPHMSLELDPGQCIEVCATSGELDGAGLGYAIRFAGKWDAWKIQHPNHRAMERVATVDTLQEAIDAIAGTLPA